MLFTRLALFAIPFLGALAAPAPAPFAKEVARDVAVEKRGSLLTIVTNLETALQGPLAEINIANGANILTANQATIYLKDVLSQINIANKAIHGVHKRDFTGLADLQSHVARAKLEDRQTADDLEEVGAVLAKVIDDVVKAVEGIADDLKYLPLVGALIISIDAGLTTLLLGVELVLVGVIAVVKGLLGSVGGLLGALGAGLLGGLLF